MIRADLGALLVAVALCVGCERPGTATREPLARDASGLPRWQTEYERLSARLQPGMSRETVRREIGPPTRRRTVLARETVEIWDYELAPNVYLRLQFNRQGALLGHSLFGEHRVH